MSTYTLKEASDITGIPISTIRYWVRNGVLKTSLRGHPTRSDSFTYWIESEDLRVFKMDFEDGRVLGSRKINRKKKASKNTKLTRGKKTTKRQDIAKWEKLGNSENEEVQYKNSPHVAGAVFLTMDEFNNLSSLENLPAETIVKFGGIAKKSVPLSTSEAKPWRSKDGHKCVLEDWLTVRKEGKKLRYDRIYITTGNYDKRKKTYPTWM